MDFNRIQSCSFSSSSSSSSGTVWKYGVFVSFRGEDTRYNFTDHLFGAFHRKGIHTFRDDTNLKKGEYIAPELLQAIEESQVLIVVFSKNYASSTWCLQELAKISDCIGVPGQNVFPIFYDVNPSEVRKQSEGYGEAFAKHEVRFKKDEEKMVEVQRWREALTRVANLSGWDVRNKPPYAEIEKITKAVTSLVCHNSLNIPNDVVGMHSQVEQLEKILDLDANDNIRVVGICGMGGIGKSTLAAILYGKISNQFDASCYIDDVSEIYGSYGSIGVQKELLCQILNDENLQICNFLVANNLIQNRFRHINALVVFDNVDKVEQLEKLPLRREWFGAGSRIIIISRDEHILKEQEVDEVYKVQLLNNDNALQLFCRKAFKSNDIMRGYTDLTHHMLRYASGLPLAIKVLGSFLFGRDISEWRSALVRLRECPPKDIMDVLRISFDALEENEKEIFLDIACFFSFEEKPYVTKLLDIRGFHADIGISILIDKSLISGDWYIHMHDLLKELGRSIVRGNSHKEPWKWTRLWDYEDLRNVMLENMAAENLEVIVIRNCLRETTMRSDALSKMNHLKVLIFWEVNFSRSPIHLSNELVYLEWRGYRFTSIPSSFQPNKLVELILPHSNIKQLWKGTKHLPNLRTMDLKHSKNLIQLPDFRGIPSLENLDLEGCVGIKQLDQSIGTLRQLLTLNLRHCKNLVSVPDNIFCLSSLQELNLSGCSKLFKNQLLKNSRQEKYLGKLDINGSSLLPDKSPSSIYRTLKLPFHVFHYSQRHKDSIGLILPLFPSFPCLKDLDLSFCNLVRIPDAIGCLQCLERLNLGGNNFVTLPSCMKELSKLRILKLEHCKQLKYLPKLPCNEVEFGGLYIYDCPNLRDMEHCYNTTISWTKQVIEVRKRA